MVDQTGLIRFVNASALAALGYDTASDLLGQPRHQTIHYKRQDGAAFPAEQCPMVPRPSGPMVHGEDWWVRQDGSMIPVKYWSVPIGMPGGPGTVVTFTDASDRLRTEQALRERDAILSALAQPVWVVTPDGVITYANPAAVTTLGFGNVSELLGQNAHLLVHYKRPDGSPFPVEDCPLTRVRATGEPLDPVEDWWVRKDGSMIPVTYTAMPIATPEGYGSAVAVTDMTALLAGEQAARDRDVARARAAELAAVQTRLVTAFDAAHQRITRDLHDGAQQRFVSTIISLQLAGQKWASDPHRARELVDLALDDARHGLDELREIATGMHPAILSQRGLTAALTALAGRLPIPVQLDLPERRLPKAVEASVYFFCAEALTNVVKHARAGSAWVRVAAADGRCTVEVRDDGIGGARAQSDGSGLTGLRDRIGALGGSVDIASPVAGGTVLRAWIPLPDDPPAETGATP